MSYRHKLTVRRFIQVTVVAASLLSASSNITVSRIVHAQDATPDATPPALIATPADDAVTQAATSAIQNVIANLGEPDVLATLVTDNLVADLGGYDSIASARADGFFDGLPFAELTTGKVVTYEDGTVGIDVQYPRTQFHLLAERWILVNEDGIWKIDSSSPIPVDRDGDSAAVGVTLATKDKDDHTVIPNVSSVAAIDVLILQVTNLTEQPLGLIVVQISGEVDLDKLLDGSIDSSQVEYIGEMLVNPDDDPTEITLISLPVGQFALISFDVDAGKSVAVARFEITAPTE